jgi:hypothetical protein
MPVRVIGRITAAAALISVGAALANAEPVFVGGNADYDACTTEGVVHKLDPQGDNFLAVRDGPGTQHRMLRKLFTGDRVYICSSSGAWLGVVYGPGDCGVSTPIARRSVYAGPCQAGWVHLSFIREVAG